MSVNRRVMRFCGRRWQRCGFCLLLLTIAFVPACRQNMAQDSSASSKRDINAVLAAHDKELLAIPNIVGVYVGVLEDGRTACLKVMLARKNPETERKIPHLLEGYPVVVELTGEIRPMSP
jgi:hypothetical protein